MSTTSTSTPAAAAPKPQLVMQIIVRKDLQDTLNWPTGPLMAQASHAATAVLHLHKDNQAVKDYLEDWEHMHKVTMQIADETGLMELSKKLSEADPSWLHHVWIEEPEHIPTALALVPNTRPNKLSKILKNAGVELWK